LPPSRLAALAALLLALPALAGCMGDEEPAARNEPIKTGSTGTGSSGTGSGTDVPAPPRPKSSSERWHFHDYWDMSPTITLVDSTVSFMPTTGGDGLPALSAIVTLPQGVIVPPETGFLTLNVTWNDTPGGLVNLTFRPADSNDFHGAGDLAMGVPFQLNVTESMADVPHRQQSLWAFNLTAKPGGTPPAVPNKDVRFTVTATIGRPLFIDAPHVNWWQDKDVIPIVQEASGKMQGATSNGHNVSIPDPTSLTAAPPRPAAFTQGQRVPVDQGRIVPEGAKSVVVSLTWESQVPGGKLKVLWREANSLTEGPMDVLVDGEGARVFAIPLDPGQTDTTYSNRTTWEFEVLPDSEPAAFSGTYTLSAWATRLAPADAVAAVAEGA
jgi:hypothetical protein